MAELTYPNRVNTQGYPALSGTPSIVTIGGVDTLVIEFNPHLALNPDWSGEFVVSLNGTIATGAQPVVFTTKGETGSTPLYLFGGEQATAAALVTTAIGSVFKCFYNADTKRLQIMGTYI